MLKSRNKNKSQQEKKSQRSEVPWTEEAAFAYDVSARSISGSLAKTNFFYTDNISLQTQPQQQFLQSSSDMYLEPNMSLQDKTGEDGDADKMKLGSVLSDEAHCFEYDFLLSGMPLSLLSDYNEDLPQINGSSSSFI
ncbi:hypothetical protein F2Q69_00063464 [Brassica cretica]|uniref:AP2/ERF domain-containing protein n=1 Tax=Brassica cretica TaxID=69181 RepID=A0A8S9RN51_BRACR|nr:hypothetical protein F2Q69_00063464 [Brassica cretica]